MCLVHRAQRAGFSQLSPHMRYFKEKWRDTPIFGPRAHVGRVPLLESCSLLASAKTVDFSGGQASVKVHMASCFAPEQDQFITFRSQRSF